MKILSNSNFVSSLMSQVHEKVVESLTPQQKKIGMIALAIFSCIAVAVYFIWKYCFKASKDTPAKILAEPETPWVEDVTLKQDIQLTVAEKKQIIKALPEWFESHFPDQIPFFKETYKDDFYFDCDGKTDDEIDTIFEELQTKIIEAFSLSHDKTSIMLVGLNLPKDDGTKFFTTKFLRVVKQILHKIWHNVLTSKEKSYAECHSQMMTFDAKAILEYEFKKNVGQIPEKKRGLWTRALKEGKCYETLKMSLMGPAFTIGVTAPKPD